MILPQHPTRIRAGTGWSFGTFGELLQGVDREGSHFLVTLPIARYTIATFEVDESMDQLSITPTTKLKSRAMASLLLEIYNLPSKGRLVIKSNLPVGKGLASSSADLVATARAIVNAYHLDFSIEKLLHCLRQIEPTDGVMFDEVVLFYHRKVQLGQLLGQLPLLFIVGKDEGGKIDTIEFNKIQRHFSWRERNEYEFLLNKVVDAMRRQDLSAIGEVSTRSATLNQAFSKKQYFEPLLDLCARVGALGLVVAHSGTCIGLLLDPANPRFHEQKKASLEYLAHLPGETVMYQTWTKNNVREV